MPKRGLKDVNFYEEKEWRYVPTTKDKEGDNCCQYYEEKNLKRVKKDYPSKPHLPGCAVKTSFRDITHLIVPNKTEKHKFINCLKLNPAITKDSRQFYDLLTKIITYNEIQYDI